MKRRRRFARQQPGLRQNKCARATDMVTSVSFEFLRIHSSIAGLGLRWRGITMTFGAGAFVSV